MNTLLIFTKCPLCGKESWKKDNQLPCECTVNFNILLKENNTIHFNVFDNTENKKNKNEKNNEY
jgi:endogenous inhibitor of DNA gyrase (YacG/DUF329 family)